MNVFTKLCCYFLLYLVAPENIAITEANGLPESNTVQYFIQKRDHFQYHDTIKFTQRYYINDVHYKGNGPVFLRVGGHKPIVAEDIQSGAYFHYAKETNGLLLCLEHRFYGNILPDPSFLKINMDDILELVEFIQFAADAEQEAPTIRKYIRDNINPMEIIFIYLYYILHWSFIEDIDIDFADFSTDNLKYLNSQQALGDLASFIKYMKHNFPNDIPPTAKWIALGVGEAGTLAARLRLKYPHLIYAAVSSSGPFLEIMNFNGYFEHVENEFKKNKDAANEIKKAYLQIYNAINDNKNEELHKILNMCSVLDKQIVLKKGQFLFWTLSTVLATVMSDSSEQLKNDVLNMMVNQSESNSLNRLAGAIDLIIKHNNKSCLLVEYDTATEQYKIPSRNGSSTLNFQLEVGLGNRQKFFQRCTEFGQFQTSDTDDGFFGYRLTLDFYVNLCKDVFGEEFELELIENAVERSQMFYGGLDIDVSNVIFVNGGQDPWSKLNLINVKTHSNFAVYTEDAHYGDDVLMNDDLKFSDAQNKILSKLKEWLGREDYLKVKDPKFIDEFKKLYYNT